jgi:hypothetical protein
MGKQRLRDRIPRYTPYCFTRNGQYECHFEFGPNASGDNVLKLELGSRYKSRIHIDEVFTDCFHCDPKRFTAPAAIEAILLQCFLEQFKVLPEANNEF